VRNPLLPSLLGLLHQQRSDGAEGVSAHQLLVRLAEHPAFSELAPTPQLQLFQKNFLLMNGLYQLQSRLWQEEQLFLSISVLHIELLSPGQGLGQTRLDEASALREYYLDWENFGQTEGGVEKLLDSFWTLFGGSEQRQTALKLLGLDQDVTEQQIKKRYRVLAARYHPDKGGDEIRFIEIRQAYETLIKS